MELFDATVKNAELRPTAYYLLDDSGLMLRVGPNGAKSWSVRYRVGKSQRRWTIGTYEKFTLKEARKLAKAALRDAALGKDPSLAKQERRTADTVDDLCSTFIERHAKPKKKSWKADQRMINVDVLPAWQHRPAKAITPRDVRELIDNVAKRGPVYANRVRALLSKMFAIGVKLEVVEKNPVVGTPRAVDETSRDHVLTDQELRQFWIATEELPLEMKAFWRLRLITAQRGGEVAAMRWADVDLDKGTWLIPPSGTKNKIAHLVPLSKPALDLLKLLREQADQVLAAREKRGDEKSAPITHVLVGARGNRQRSEAAQTFDIPNFRGHDLRRTAATNMAIAGVPSSYISYVLNHKQSGPAATHIYVRYEGIPEKKVALDQWARTLTNIIEKQEGANVIAFARS